MGASVLDSGAGEVAALPLQPLRDYILAEEDLKGSKSGGGVILPSNTLGQPAFAEVKAVGVDLEGKFAAGETIVYTKADAVNVYLRGQEYILVKATSVMAKALAED